MTDMTTYQPPEVTQLPSIIQTAAQDMNGAMTVANGIVGTSFVPQHFRGKPEEAAAAILYGATLGFDPLTSLQQLYSIGGKPALYSRAMVAVVLSKGHKIWTVEDTPNSVTVAGQRKGSDHVEQITWTIDRAKTAGYTSNSNYKKDPHAMLYARASGDVARRIAPDALLGLAYSAEELQLGEGTTSTQQVTADQFLPKQAADPHEAAHTPPSQAQFRALYAVMQDGGVDTKDKPAIYAWLGERVGREITSGNDLSNDEASYLIDQAQAAAAASEYEEN